MGGATRRSEGVAGSGCGEGREATGIAAAAVRTSVAAEGETDSGRQAGSRPRARSRRR